MRKKVRYRVRAQVERGEYGSPNQVKYNVK